MSCSCDSSCVIVHASCRLVSLRHTFVFPSTFSNALAVSFHLFVDCCYKDGGNSHLSYSLIRQISMVVRIVLSYVIFSLMLFMLNSIFHFHTSALCLYSLICLTYTRRHMHTYTTVCYKLFSLQTGCACSVHLLYVAWWPARCLS